MKVEVMDNRVAVDGEDLGEVLTKILSRLEKLERISGELIQKDVLKSTGSGYGPKDRA